MEDIKPKKLDFKENQIGVIFEDIKRFGDDRGDFTNIDLLPETEVNPNFKRTYFINNNQRGVIRAFHGHKKEAKLLYVPKGAFKIILMNMETMEWKDYALLESVPKTLYIPPGYYNGFVSLTDDAQLVVFSTSTIKESMEDDFRLPHNFLGKEVWGINHR